MQTAGRILLNRNLCILYIRDTVSVRKYACAAFCIRRDRRILDRSRSLCREHCRADTVKAGIVTARAVRRCALDRAVTDGDLCVILHENGILVRARGSDRLSLNRLVTGVGIGCGVLPSGSAGGVWLVDVSVVAACASVFPLLITALPATADTATPAASAIANSFLFPLNLRIIIVCTCLSELICVCLLLFFVLKAGYNMNLKWGLSPENFYRNI